MIDEMFKEQAEYSYALHTALQLEEAFVDAGLLDHVEAFFSEAADTKTLIAAFNVTTHLLKHIGLSNSLVEEKMIKASARLIR